MRICLVARAGLELVTFRSQSRRFSSTPHMSTKPLYIFLFTLQLSNLPRYTPPVPEHHSQEHPPDPFHISCPSHCLHFNHLSHNTLPQTLPTPQDSNIPPFFHPTIRPSRHPVIPSSRHPAIPP